MFLSISLEWWSIWNNMHEWKSIEIEANRNFENIIENRLIEAVRACAYANSRSSTWFPQIDTIRYDVQVCKQSI